MTSKERVKLAFLKSKSDRVPINYSGNGVITKSLMDYFAVTDYYDLLNALDTDFRPLYATYKGKLLFDEIKGCVVDPVYGFYTKWIKNESGGYWDFCNYPLQNASEDKIANFPVPSPDDFDYEHIGQLIKTKFADRALHVGGAGDADIINSTGRVMGMEDTLINIQLEDEATLFYINKRCDMELGRMERLIDKYKKEVDFVWIGEDLGTQIAPMISLKTYRKVIKPMHQRYVDLAKAYDLPVMIHTCGSSSWAYNDFIEMGINGVDTLQPEATNMSAQYLVDNYGGRLSFHGCISTANSLAYGSTNDVEREVQHVLDIMKPTYSYMLAPTHAIQDNTRLENVLKMYETAKTYGKY